MLQVQDAEVRSYLDAVEAIRLDARSVADGLTHGQFNWRRSSSSWSVGQCLQHITLTLRLYPAKIEAMIGEAGQRASSGERPYREGAFSRWFVRSMEPPPTLRVRTARKVEPGTDLQREVVVREFDAENVRLAELIAAADGVSLRHGRTRSPFMPLLRFTLGQVFAMNLAHARRHLWQARQVRQLPGFPSV
jgi:hypothetical protein